MTLLCLMELPLLKTPLLINRSMQKLICHEGGLLWKGKVIGRTKYGDSRKIGSCDPNQFLNTLTCDVESSDGKIKECSASATAESVCPQVDKDGYNT